MPVNIAGLNGLSLSANARIILAIANKIRTERKDGSTGKIEGDDILVAVSTVQSTASQVLIEKGGTNHSRLLAKLGLPNTLDLLQVLPGGNGDLNISDNDFGVIGKGSIRDAAILARLKGEQEVTPEDLLFAVLDGNKTSEASRLVEGTTSNNRSGREPILEALEYGKYHYSLTVCKNVAAAFHTSSERTAAALTRARIIANQRSLYVPVSTADLLLAIALEKGSRARAILEEVGLGSDKLRTARFYSERSVGEPTPASVEVSAGYNPTLDLSKELTRMMGSIQPAGPKIEPEDLLFALVPYLEGGSHAHIVLNQLQEAPGGIKERILSKK